MKISECSAVILDMDGLVLDTEKTYFCAWQKAAEKMGCQLTESFCHTLSGLPYYAVETMLLNLFGDSFQAEQFRHLSSEYWYEHVQEHGITLKKGFYSLMSVLEKLNIPYCLATNSLKNNALECLNFAGVSELFSVLITRDQVKHAKPAPDLFLRAAEQLEHSIENCMVVEDSSVGILAAKAAGAFAVYIPSYQPEMSANADLILDDLGQLAEMIQDGRITDQV